MCELELEDQLRLLKDGLTELAIEIGDRVFFNGRFKLI